MYASVKLVISYAIFNNHTPKVFPHPFAKNMVSVNFLSSGVSTGGRFVRRYLSVSRGAPWYRNALRTRRCCHDDTHGTLGSSRYARESSRSPRSNTHNPWTSFFVGVGIAKAAAKPSSFSLNWKHIERMNKRMIKRMNMIPTAVKSQSGYSLPQSVAICTNNLRSWKQFLVCISQICFWFESHSYDSKTFSSRYYFN